MAMVGYLDGTDPVVLTRLNLRGIATLPLGNGFDAHGKYIGHLTKKDNVSVVVGYLHKIMPPVGIDFLPSDFLSACHTHDIPVLVVVPKGEHDLAREILGEAADWITMVDPGELYEKALALCQ